MAKAVDGYINLEFVIRKEDDQYSSWCPDLDIASSGDTPEEAAKNISDALELYLGTIEDAGERKNMDRQPPPPGQCRRNARTARSGH